MVACFCSFVSNLVLRLYILSKQARQSMTFLLLNNLKNALAQCSNGLTYKCAGFFISCYLRTRCAISIPRNKFEEDYDIVKFFCDDEPPKGKNKPIK